MFVYAQKVFYRSVRPLLNKLVSVSTKLRLQPIYMYGAFDLGRKICSTYYFKTNKLTYLRLLTKLDLKQKQIVHTSLKKAFRNTSSRIVFVFIDLFMVTHETEGAADSVLLKHPIRIGNESFMKNLQNKESRTSLPKVKLNVCLKG